MSGFIGVLLGGGGGRVNNPLLGGAASSATTYPNAAMAGWRWNSNGTVDVRVQGFHTYNHNWYTPTTVGIGSSFYIHHGTVTGTALTTDSVGTTGTTSLSAGAAISLYTPVGFGIISSSMTINITSASGTTPIVGSGTYTIDVEMA